MLTKEIPLVFDCQGSQLLGVIHQSDDHSEIGMLIVVGGPQYRVGSHRQFVLLARYLAARGIPVMRFDARGMGDSEGDTRRFDELDADIRSAVDCFMRSENLQRLVIWGLCDAASAALFYAYQDRRVAGLVLLNPWVFTEQGVAKTYLKHYYVQRLFSHEFWRKVFSLKFEPLASLKSLLGLLKTVMKQKNGESTAVAENAVLVSSQLPLPVRMRECWKHFAKPILLILSGRDLTADEFREAVQQDEQWQALLKEEHVTRYNVSESDHTFSSAAWREKVAESTLNWIRTLN